MLAWDNVMTGDNAREFVDYYALLNVDPASDAKTLEKAYRHHAQLYHPDHSDTSDVEKFQAVNEAYGVLRNPEKRAKYDQLHASIIKATTPLTTAAACDLPGSAFAASAATVTPVKARIRSTPDM